MIEQHDGLTLQRVSVEYGKLTAVRSVSLSVRPGELVAVIGPNSAGKTSLLEAIAEKSAHRRVRGTITVDGLSVAGMSTLRRQTKGVRLVPEGRQVFPNLTVEENLRIITDALDVAWPPALERAQALFPRVFAERLRIPAGSLSGGEQQMLALARALVGEPRVLLLDEPGLGLAPGAISDVASALGRLCGTGIPVVVADQGLRNWQGLVSRAFVLLRGEVVGCVADQAEVNDLLGDLLEGGSSRCG